MYTPKGCPFIQVGLTEKGNVFVIVGSNRIQPEAFVEFTPKELRKFKVQCVNY